MSNRQLDPEKCPNLIESCRRHYRKVRARGAIWIKDFEGKWFSDYCEGAADIYASQFPDHVQELIAE